MLRFCKLYTDSEKGTTQIGAITPIIGAIAPCFLIFFCILFRICMQINKFVNGAIAPMKKNNGAEKKK